MWPIGRLVRLRHCRTVNAFTSPTVWWFRNSATDRRDEMAGSRLQLGVEADDALRKTLGMPVSPWWQPQLPALRTLPTRHRASFAGDAPPCALTKVAVKSARHRPGKNVRAPANRDSIQANAIPLENTLKHSVTEMFFLILACCQDRGGSGPGPAGRPEIGGPQARHLALVPASGSADLSRPKEPRLCPRHEVAPIPKVFARARRPASRDLTGRSRDCLRTQS